MSTYRVLMEPIEDGWWMASVPRVRGCRTQARSVSQAKRRIREALSLFVKDAEKASLDVHLKLPSDFTKALKTFKAETEIADAAQKRSKQLARLLARRALKELHLTMREAAELLGYSHQRIEQLTRNV